MVWLYRLKNLSLLTWIVLCLLLLNISGRFLLFPSDSAQREFDDSYPSLRLFSSEILPENDLISTLHEKNVAEAISVKSEVGKKTVETPALVVDEGKPESKTAHALDTPNVPENHLPKNTVIKDSFSGERLCYEVGPINSLQRRNRLQNILETKGMFVSTKFYESKQNLGYWVFIPPLHGRALGRLKVEELKLKGFKNAVLLRKNEPINAVSLGLFDEQRRAHELLLKAQALGFDARMDVRSRGINSAWLVVEVARQRDLPQKGWSILLADYSQAEVRSTDCS